MVFPASSVRAYSLDRLVKSALVGQNFGSAVLTYMISEARWKALPQNARDAMQQAGESATRRICAYADGELAADLEKIQAKGARTMQLPAAEKASLAEVSATVRTEWAESLDKRGRPGSEVLKAFTEALR